MINSPIGPSSQSSDSVAIAQTRTIKPKPSDSNVSKASAVISAKTEGAKPAGLSKRKASHKPPQASETVNKQGVQQILHKEPAKSVSASTMKAINETKWSSLEITEEESKAYMNNLESYALCQKDVDAMREASSVTLSNGKELLPAEHAALKFYTQHGFSFVNPLLNNNCEQLERAMKEMGVNGTLAQHEQEILLHAKVMTSALNKLPASENEELYRGALLTLDQFKEYGQALQQKQPVTEKQILSTTTSLDVANKFVLAKKERIAERYAKEVINARNSGAPRPKKPEYIAAMFAVKQNASAKEIQQFSTAAAEAEAVFIPQTGFRVGRILGPDQVPPPHRDIYSCVILLEKI